MLRELATANTSPVLVTSPMPASAAWLLALPAVGVGVAGLLSLPRGHPRAVAAALAAFAAAAIGVPFLAGATPFDFFYDRNLIAAWPAALVALAVGLAAFRRVGAAAAGAIAAAGVIASVQIAADPGRQRDDWRGVAGLIGATDRPRALVVRPRYGVSPLRVYGRQVGAAIPGTGVEEIVVVGAGVARAQLPPRLAGFELTEARRVQRMGLARYSAAAMQRLDAGTIASGGGAVFYEPSDAARRWFTRALAAGAGLQRAAEAPLDSEPAGLHEIVAARAALADVPAEVAGAPRLRRRWSSALDAAAALLEAPTPRTRAELAAAVRRLAA